MAKYLDHALYQEYKAIPAFIFLGRLTGSAAVFAKQKKAVISGGQASPALDYSTIDGPALHEARVKLLRLRKKCQLKAFYSPIHQLYKERVDEDLRKAALLLAVRSGRVRQVRQISQQVFGTVDQRYYQLALAVFLNKYAGKAGIEDLKKEICYATNVAEPNWSKLFTSAIKKSLLENSQGAFGEFPVKNDAKMITSQFKSYLKKLDINNWQVKVVADARHTIRTDRTGKTILIPKDKVVSGQRLKELLHHEIGTHIYRAERGAGSKLKLLERGLAGYEKGEEGLAILRSQADKTEFKPRGAINYCAVAWAAGIDGTPRNFAQLYELLKLVMSDGAAWRYATRAFRGTQFKDSGICFTGDVIYFRGLFKLLEALEQTPALLANGNLDAGKYDPTNRSQVKTLFRLGILK